MQHNHTNLYGDFYCMIIGGKYYFPGLQRDHFSNKVFSAIKQHKPVVAIYLLNELAKAIRINDQSKNELLRLFYGEYQYNLFLMDVIFSVYEHAAPRNFHQVNNDYMQIIIDALNLMILTDSLALVDFLKRVIVTDIQLIKIEEKRDININDVENLDELIRNNNKRATLERIIVSIINTIKENNFEIDVTSLEIPCCNHPIIKLYIDANEDITLFNQFTLEFSHSEEFLDLIIKGYPAFTSQQCLLVGEAILKIDNEVFIKKFPHTPLINTKNYEAVSLNPEIAATKSYGVQSPLMKYALALPYLHVAGRHGHAKDLYKYCLNHITGKSGLNLDLVNPEALPTEILQTLIQFKIIHQWLAWEENPKNMIEWSKVYDSYKLGKCYSELKTVDAIELAYLLLSKEKNRSFIMLEKKRGDYRKIKEAYEAAIEAPKLARANANLCQSIADEAHHHAHMALKQFQDIPNFETEAEYQRKKDSALQTQRAAAERKEDLSKAEEQAKAAQSIFELATFDFEKMKQHDLQVSIAYENVFAILESKITDFHNNNIEQWLNLYFSIHLRDNNDQMIKKVASFILAHTEAFQFLIKNFNKSTTSDFSLAIKALFKVLIKNQFKPAILFAQQELAHPEKTNDPTFQLLLVDIPDLSNSLTYLLLAFFQEKNIRITQAASNYFNEIFNSDDRHRFSQKKVIFEIAKRIKKYQANKSKLTTVSHPLAFILNEEIASAEPNQEVIKTLYQIQVIAFRTLFIPAIKNSKDGIQYISNFREKLYAEFLLGCFWYVHYLNFSQSVNQNTKTQDISSIFKNLLSPLSKKMFRLLESKSKFDKLSQIWNQCVKEGSTDEIINFLETYSTMSLSKFHYKFHKPNIDHKAFLVHLRNKIRMEEEGELDTLHCLAKILNSLSHLQYNTTNTSLPNEKNLKLFLLLEECMSDLSEKELNNNPFLTPICFTMLQLLNQSITLVNKVANSNDEKFNGKDEEVYSTRTLSNSPRKKLSGPNTM